MFRRIALVLPARSTQIEDICRENQIPNICFASSVLFFKDTQIFPTKSDQRGALADIQYRHIDAVRNSNEYLTPTDCKQLGIYFSEYKDFILPITAPSESIESVVRYISCLQSSNLLICIQLFNPANKQEMQHSFPIKISGGVIETIDSTFGITSQGQIPVTKFNSKLLGYYLDDQLDYHSARYQSRVWGQALK